MKYGGYEIPAVWERKGFGENPRITIAQPAESKNSSRAKQVEIFLRKSRKNYLARELKANEGIIPRFVAGEAYHTCAALGGRGESQRPGPLVTFGTKVTPAQRKKNLWLHKSKDSSPVNRFRMTTRPPQAVHCPEKLSARSATG